MGRIEIFEMKPGYIEETRKIRVYLPDNYDSTAISYPVVYMHDAQNLYVDEDAFGNCSWGVSKTLESMEAYGGFDGLIVVGIDNCGERRFEDYSPWKNTIDHAGFRKETRGGDGAQYARFIVNDLKPKIDQCYRTHSDKGHTAICGSSMGGLISAYMAAAWPEIFGCAGSFSIASWFAAEAFERFIMDSQFGKEQRFFIQVGTAETVCPEEADMPQLFIDMTMKYVHMLLEKGVPYSDICLKLDAGGEHCEKVWRKYMQEFFEFFTRMP